MRVLHGLLLKALIWRRAAVGAIFMISAIECCHLPPAAVAQELPARAGFSIDRWNRGFFLAASVRNAAVLVRASRADNMQLLLVDFESAKRVRLKSDRSHLQSPYLSPDGTRLLFSRQPFDGQGHELISCETSTLTCRIELKSSGSIQSAIEISGGRILYVSSPYVKGLDGQIRLSRNDIWIFDPSTGSRQLTDFQLYELHSLSVTRNEIYFSALGPRRDRPVFPKYEPAANQQSDIFRLPFDQTTGTIETPSEMLMPLFERAGIATRPSASTDGAVIAFLRTRTGISPYHFNLVVADRNNRERLIDASGMGSSRPVVIDHDVYASVTMHDRVLIGVIRPDEPSMKVMANLDDASVAASESVELKIAP